MIEEIGKNREDKESYSDGYKHQKMKCIELLSFRYIKCDDEDDKSRNDEECLEEIHEKRMVRYQRLEDSIWFFLYLQSFPFTKTPLSIYSSV